MNKYSPRARARDAIRQLRHAADSVIRMREAQQGHPVSGKADAYCHTMVRLAPMFARRVYEYRVITGYYEDR